LPDAAQAMPVRSMTTASTPFWLRKYAIEAPITPPPQINTRIAAPPPFAPTRA
jgi:hypothetical protein